MGFGWKRHLFHLLVVVTVVQVLVVVVFYYTLTKPNNNKFHNRDNISEIDKALNSHGARLSFHTEDVVVLDTSSGIHSYTSDNASEIVIAVAACGRLPELFNMIKSALVFSRSPIMFHIFTERQYFTDIMKTLSRWRDLTMGRMRYNIRNTIYPEAEDTEEWKRLVTSCASQRLFFPDILRDEDALLFVDSDVLFMGAVEEVWSVFQEMAETRELAAVIAGTTLNRNAAGPHENHPYYGMNGINAGVMIMNLTRLRASNFTAEIVHYYHEYKPHLISGDQDLVNIYMFFHEERIYPIPFSRFNFRHYCCSPAFSSTRVGLREKGILIVHGMGSSFLVAHPVYMRLFTSWTEYDLETDPYLNLYQKLKFILNAAPHTQCREFKDAFLTGLSRLKIKIV